MSASLMVKVRNIERLISRCEDALGRNSKLKLHSWRTSKVVCTIQIQDTAFLSCGVCICCIYVVYYIATPTIVCPVAKRKDSGFGEVSRR